MTQTSDITAKKYLLGKRSRTQNCFRPLRWPAMNWKQQFWIYDMGIAPVNSTTAAQPVFMTCPGSVNVLSMGNTLCSITFFSALKEFTSCHNMARAKILWLYFVPCVQKCGRTYVLTCIPMYLPTHTHTCVTAHRPKGTHVHSFIRTYTY